MGLVHKTARFIREKKRWLHGNSLQNIVSWDDLYLNSLPPIDLREDFHFNWLQHLELREILSCKWFHHIIPWCLLAYYICMGLGARRAGGEECCTDFNF